MSFTWWKIRRRNISLFFFSPLWKSEIIDRLFRFWHWKIWTGNYMQRLHRTAVQFGNFAKIKCATARNKLRSILGTFQGFHGIRANSREWTITDKRRYSIIVVRGETKQGLWTRHSNSNTRRFCFHVIIILVIVIAIMRRV